jgi:daunosaminyl-N,N-dimethyltransferase/N-dimethyltransferase
MLTIARRKVPSVPLFEADLRAFSVDRPVDAALCLFSSCGYLYDDEARARSLGCFAQAVRPGGVLLLEPFVSADSYREGSTHLQTYEGSELKCVRASVSRRVGDVAVIDFAWLVLRQGASSIDHFTETHSLALHDAKRLDRLVEAAGFEPVTVATHLVGDRSLVAARRR